MVEEIDLHYRFDSPWYRSPNLDMIRQNACRLGAETPKPELRGILERMSPRLKEQLSTDSIEYHFRKVAIRDFCSLQEEEADKHMILLADGQRCMRPGLTPIIKNTVFIAHLEPKLVMISMPRSPTSWMWYFRSPNKSLSLLRGRTTMLVVSGRIPKRRRYSYALPYS
jgi:hypothetical protein